MALLAILLFALLLMPIAVMLSIGTPTLDWLAKKPDAKNRRNARILFRANHARQYLRVG